MQFLNSVFLQIVSRYQTSRNPIFEYHNSGEQGVGINTPDT